MVSCLFSSSCEDISTPRLNFEQNAGKVTNCNFKRNGLFMEILTLFRHYRVLSPIIYFASDFNLPETGIFIMICVFFISYLSVQIVWLTVAIVRTREDWAELAVLTFLNMCTDKGLNKYETVRYFVSTVPTDSNNSLKKRNLSLRRRRQDRRWKEKKKEKQKKNKKKK